MLKKLLNLFKKTQKQSDKKQCETNQKINISTIIKEKLKLLEIGILTKNCPYCGEELNNFPTRKIKCKNCGNPIYVRTRPLDKQKVLIKENEIDLIENEWNKNFQLKNLDSLTSLSLEIYSFKKPEIINFISDSDYQVLLNFYTAHLYGSKIDLNTILKPYPYAKYDWNVLLQIIWTYQNSCKRLEEMKNSGIMKVKIDCKDCDGCKQYLNKKIFINEVPEIPNKNCTLETRVCLFAHYYPVMEFDLS